MNEEYKGSREGRYTKERNKKLHDTATSLLCSTKAIMEGLWWVNLLVVITMDRGQLIVEPTPTGRGN